MVAQNDSVVRKAAFKKWPLDETSGKESALDNLLEALTKNQKTQQQLFCKGCELGDTFCNCSLSQISHENTFQVFLVVESKKNFGTHWCPQLSVKSDFLYCDEEKTERISSKLICDGVVHCPVTKIDESHYVCSPWHLKLIAIGIVFGIYFAAMGVAIGVLCCRPTSGKGRREELAEDQRAKYRRYFISSGSSSRALPRQTSKA